MPAGKRSRRVGFERATAARGALGGKSAVTWSAAGSRLAGIRYGSGAERQAATAEGATQAATVRVLADDLTRTITARERITFDGLAWDITAIAPIGQGNRGEIEFTVTANRG